MLLKKTKKQKGQSLTEYLILVALVAISSIGIVKLLGHTVNVQFSNITNSLQGRGVRKIEANEVRDTLHTEKDLSDFMRNSTTRDRK